MSHVTFQGNIEIMVTTYVLSVAAFGYLN